MVRCEGECKGAWERAGTAECGVNGGRYEINQLLIENDTALVVGSEEKLCRLVSEFGEYAKEES